MTNAVCAFDKRTMLRNTHWTMADSNLELEESAKELPNIARVNFLKAQVFQLERTNACTTDALNAQHHTLGALVSSLANVLGHVLAADGVKRTDGREVVLPADAWEQIVIQVRRAHERTAHKSAVQPEPRRASEHRLILAAATAAARPAPTRPGRGHGSATTGRGDATQDGLAAPRNRTSAGNTNERTRPGTTSASGAPRPALATSSNSPQLAGGVRPGCAAGTASTPRLASGTAAPAGGLPRRSGSGGIAGRPEWND
jgi:hypothetical protein